MKKNLALSVGFFFIFSLGCKLFVQSGPEFAVSSPVYKKGKTGESCELGGVCFDFYNKSSKKVISIETKMNVYNPATKQTAFAGVGTITSSFNGEIEAGQKKEMCVSLDEYITTACDIDFLIEQFYISRILYSDGSEWKDYFGVYAQTSGG